MSGDHWKKGLRLTEPGVYVDPETLKEYIDVEEFLAARGKAFTIKNVIELFDELHVAGEPAEVQ
jgi:hypothetical protein